jgi:hypothetical protein
MITLAKEFIMDEERLEESPDDALFPEEAAAYLERLWNEQAKKADLPQRPFTSRDWNNFRNNRAEEITALKIKPVSKAQFMTTWRRSDLAIIAEKIEAPRLREEVRKPRPRRSSKKTES